jgi:hypothetical protein
VSFCKVTACLLVGSVLSAPDVHVIEVLADKDSRYKISGQKKPEITVRAGEAGPAEDYGAQGKNLESRRDNSRIYVAARVGPIQG